MEKRGYLKYFLGCCCVSVIIFCLAVPSFAWESETEFSKNLIFSVRIFSIPESFNFGKMSFSYHGVAGKSSGINDIDLVSLEGPILGIPLVGHAGEPDRPQGLNDRIRKMGSFLLRYINVGGQADGGKEPVLFKPNQSRNQNISFEFQSTPSDLSGAVLFTVNI